MRKWLLPLTVLVSVACYADTPARIVSTSGNASEVIYRLGLADHLVAVDTTSVLPPEVMSKKPKIGYRRNLSAEGILSLTPDLVILAPDAGPPTVVNQLKDSGVAVFYLEDEKTLDGINKDISRLGEVLEVADKAAALVAEQKDEEVALEKSKAAYARTPEVVILMDTGNGVVGLGQESAGSHLADILGAKLSLDFEGMKQLSNEALVLNEADAVLIASRNNAEDNSIINPLAAGRYEALDLHPAAARDCVFEVNIMRSLGFGPDTAKTAQEIADTIAPCIKDN